MRAKNRIVAAVLSVILVFGATYAYAMGRMVIGERIDTDPIMVPVGEVNAVPLGTSTNLGDSYRDDPAFQQRRQEIVDEWERRKPTYAFTGYNNIFDVMPSTAPPYAAGSLKSDFLDDGLKMVNFYRFLVGLNPVVLNPEWTDRAQHGTVLSYKSGMGHRPARPSDMPQDFYERALLGTTNGNLYASGNTLSNAVAIWMEDAGADNANTMGHRRKIISPGLVDTGFGKTGSHHSMYATNQLFSSNPNYPNRDYIAYPSETAFPSEVFSASTYWSISLHDGRYRSTTADLGDLKVTLTRPSTGTVWEFTTDQGLRVDTQNFGTKYCLIFRPGGISHYQGTYDVLVTGLKDSAGNPAADISYRVNFFELSDYVTDIDGMVPGGDGGGDGDGSGDGNGSGNGNGDGSGNGGNGDGGNGSGGGYYPGSGSSSGGGSGRTGGGGGGGGNSSRSAAAVTTSANVSASGAVSPTKIKEDLTRAINNSFDETVSVRVKNASTIAPTTLRTMAATAAEAGRVAVLYADTMAADGITAQGRLYVEPAKLVGLQKDLKLKIYTESTKTAPIRKGFEKWFNNRVAVVRCEQKGSFGARLHLAVLVDLTGLDTGNLLFYSYDSSSNRYVRIENPAYVIDSKGYLHFFTELAGDIIITDQPLTPK